VKFELNEYERAAFKNWNAAHVEAAHNGVEPYAGAIGGRVSFRIVSTSIGDIVSAECGFCCTAKGRDDEALKSGAAVVLTDFSDW
jgi:hypothetical protein